MKRLLKLLFLPVLTLCACSTSQDKCTTTVVTPDDKLVVYGQDGQEIKLTPAAQNIETSQFVISACELKDYADYFTVEFRLAKSFVDDGKMVYTWASKDEETSFYSNHEKQGMEKYSKPFFAYRYTDGNSYVIEGETEIVLKATDTIPEGATNLSSLVSSETVNKEVVRGMNIVHPNEISYYKAAYRIPKGAIIVKDYLVTIDTDISGGEQNEEYVYFPISVNSKNTSHGELNVGDKVNIFGNKTITFSTGEVRQTKSRLAEEAEVVSIISGSFDDEGTASCTFKVKRQQLENITSYVNTGGSLFFTKNIISPTAAECYDVNKEKTYLVLELTKYTDYGDFFEKMKELLKQENFGFYIIDLSFYNETELNAINVSTEYIQYRVFTTNYITNGDDTITESRYLLYTGLYRGQNILKEIEFVKKYGVVDQPYYLKGTSNLYMCYSKTETGTTNNSTKIIISTFYAYVIGQSETISNDNFTACVDGSQEQEYKPINSFNETIAYAGSEYAVTVMPQFDVPADAEMIVINYKSSFNNETLSFKMSIL